MRTTKRRLQNKLAILDKFRTDTLLPVTYLHARFRRSVVEVALEKGHLVPSYTSPKAVLFHKDHVDSFDRKLATGEIKMTVTR
jgi:hypothetical protein